MREVSVPLKNIPQEVLDQVLDELGHYLVPLIAFSPNAAHDPMTFAGRGTLVKIDGVHGILTAAHVWNLVRDREQLMLILGKQQSAFCIQTAELRPYEVWGRVNEQLGPDLALIPLSELHAATIEAKKSFLNLVRQQSLVPSRPQKGDVCAILGMVGALSELTKDESSKMAYAHVQVRAFIGAIEEYHSDGDWDYVDVGAQTSSPGVPNSFGGVSGGALWSLRLIVSKNGEIIWDQNRTLLGVAFWQSASTQEHRTIRCHGPRSLFETAWERWALLGRPVSNSA